MEKPALKTRLRAEQLQLRQEEVKMLLKLTLSGSSSGKTYAEYLKDKPAHARYITPQDHLKGKVELEYDKSALMRIGGKRRKLETL